MNDTTNNKRYMIYCATVTPMGLKREWLSSVCPRKGFETLEAAKTAASTIYDPKGQLTISIEEKQ